MYDVDLYNIHSITAVFMVSFFLRDLKSKTSVIKVIIPNQDRNYRPLLFPQYSIKIDSGNI